MNKHQPPHSEIDDEPDDLERARAAAFTRALDGKAGGINDDTAELVELAQVIAASAAPTELGAARTRALVDGVLGSAVGMPAPVQRKRSLAPWIVAAMTGTLAVAAAIVLLVSRHQLSTVEVKYPQAAATRAPLSHPSDALIGAISRGQSGDAANRIDEIFADRLDGMNLR